MYLQCGDQSNGPSTPATCWSNRQLKAFLTSHFTSCPLLRQLHSTVSIRQLAGRSTCHKKLNMFSLLRLCLNDKNLFDLPKTATTSKQQVSDLSKESLEFCQLVDITAGLHSTTSSLQSVMSDHSSRNDRVSRRLQWPFRHSVPFRAVGSLYLLLGMIHSPEILLCLYHVFLSHGLNACKCQMLS